MSFLKPISISLSPNTEKDDVWLAFKLKFQPWRYKKGEKIKELEEEFKKYLGVKYAISFNSGRSAFLSILSSLGLEKGAEILLQAFTCNAAANPIIWAGLKPVYIDCDEKTFNIDIEDLKRKITSKSRVVIVQHTFGLPADIDRILEICKQNNLILIEDCAHSLGVEYRSKKIGLSTEALAKVGTFSKVAFFSFSRDKVISSVYGGMVTTDDEELAKKIKEFQEKIGYPSCCWILQQLCHPVLLNWLIVPTYRYFGKYIFILFQELHILSKAVHWKEKIGEKPDYFPKRLPNVLAVLALNQFKKLERFNNHRKEIASFYYNELKNSSFLLPKKNSLDHIFLRFTVKHSGAHKIIRKAWDNNILIGDWYTTPIAPEYNKLEKIKHGKKSSSETEKLEKAQYRLGSCPKAEKLAKQVFNLPTHINISKKQAQKIIDFLKVYGN